MSIPKIIHYFYDDINIWEKNPSPQFRICYASWKKFCPDYEIKLWHVDMPEFKEMLKSSKFLRECYKRKMYGSLSDYVRYYALYNYGGIYIDTDVQLLNNFDEYLDKQFFVSIESDIINGENIPEPAIIGGQKGCGMFKSVLDVYNSDEIFKIDFPIANIILQKVLKEKLDFSRVEYLNQDNNKIQKFYDSTVHITQMSDYEMYKSQRVFEKDNICIYPSEYFCPAWNVFGEKAFTQNTISIHWGQCSWWKQKNLFRELQSYRYKNPVKRFWYKYSEKVAKTMTFWIPNKNLRRMIREKLIFN